MPPKCKPSSPLLGGKQMKKGNHNESEELPIVQEDDDSCQQKSGKILKENKNTDNGGFMTVTNRFLPSKSMNKNNENKAFESPNLALNKYLQQKAKISMHGSLRWKTYLFPFHPKSPSFAKSTQKYFGLDLVEEEKERTYWTHKASVWQDLFEGINHIAETENIDGIGNEFDGIFAAGLQAEPKGPNEIKTFKTSNNKYIQQWILMVPMPIELEYFKYIPKFLSQFQSLCKMPLIQSGYKSGVAGFSHYPGLMNQLSENGSYWQVLDNAIEKDIIIEECHCLAEVLMDNTIKEVVSRMFHVKKGQDVWADDVKAYAFGY